jgi:hypothetical protein
VIGGPPLRRRRKGEKEVIIDDATGGHKKEEGEDVREKVYGSDQPRDSCAWPIMLQHPLESGKGQSEQDSQQESAQWRVVEGELDANAREDGGRFGLSFLKRGEALGLEVGAGIHGKRWRTKDETFKKMHQHQRK